MPRLCAGCRALPIGVTVFFVCLLANPAKRLPAVILVLTAGFGDGHNSAAAAAAEAFRRLCPGEEVRVCDLVSEVLPRLAGVLKGLYQQAITHAPAAWRLVYRLLEHSELDPDRSPWLVPLVHGLQDRLAAESPRLLVSTYPLHAALLEVLRRQGRPLPPLVTVITDSISVHRIWTREPSDLFCVADEETRAVVAAQGVPEARIRVTGFPVSLRFAEPAAGATPGPRRLLYLPSTPARHVAATLRALTPLMREGLHVTLPVGKHRARLYHVLRRFTDAWPAAPLEVLGWTDRMPELLRSHDVVVCKAGGAILHEVLAARIPAVIDYVVPGQEEGNAEMLLSRDSALRSHTPAETADAVRQILADHHRLGTSMREGMTAISVPDAALRTARAALEFVRN